jgi:hypothetical protein
MAAEVRTASDRNKMILAIALGGLALLSLLYAFGGGIIGSGGTTRITVTASPTPKPADKAADPDKFRMPTQAEEDFTYQSVPISYSPAVFNAPDPGRNIFAFYEPPPPCPDCPTPTPKPPPPATPAPTPPVFIAYVTPQSAYAGSKAVRIEVHGDRFDPSTKIYLNGMEMPTAYVSGQRMSVDIPSNMLSSEGSLAILVRNSDGKLFSNQAFFSVQAPPKPAFKYIGMIARQHANNDTAYYTEAEKPTPMTARLNDVIAGRFRVVSISAERMIVEDTSLGFRHSVNIEQAAQGTPTFGSGQPGPGGRGFPSGGYVPYTPNNPNFNGIPAGSIPGIPDNIPRVNPNPPANVQRPPEKKEDDGQDVDG